MKYLYLPDCYEAHKGSSLADCIDEAIALSGEQKKTINFMFNDIYLNVYEGSTTNEVLRQFGEKRKQMEK